MMSIGGHVGPKTQGPRLVPCSSAGAIRYLFQWLIMVFLEKVNDNVPERWERPEKYLWVCHAETNSVLNCAQRGYSSEGTTLYTQGVPCAGCADAIVQGGIIGIVIHKQWQEYEKKFGQKKWIESAERSEEKLKEAGIKVRVFDGVLGMQGVLDGKVIDV